MMNELSPSTQEAIGRLLGRVMEARERQDGVPFVVAHFVTARCNCKCRSCLWKNNDTPDVPLEDLKSFYAQARDAGFVAAALSGGAPFVRQDLGELVRFMKEEAQMAILLFNTGWFLEQRMDEVAPFIDMMIVSVDSAVPSRHDEIRGLPGLFDRLVRGVKAMRERYPHVPLHLNTCVQKGIEPEIDGLIGLAEELGVKISFDFITEARNAGDGSAFTSTDMGLSLPEVQAVAAHLLEKKRAGAPIVNTGLYFDYMARGRPGYHCHLPKVAMSLDARGNVEDCLALERPIGNIRETPLKEIMARQRFLELRRDAEGCSSCNSPTMVDCSHIWERPELLLSEGGLAF
ncbi:MAG: radical SAM protein [Deltaproteobacteria bacterium]|nr:radical SAM protein [Deltaproteobacteria bacterium]